MGAQAGQQGELLVTILGEATLVWEVLSPREDGGTLTFSYQNSNWKLW